MALQPTKERDDEFKMHKTEVFSAVSASGDRHTHYRFWKVQSGDWMIIRTVTDAREAFPNAQQFFVPKELVSVMIRETAKEKLKE